MTRHYLRRPYVVGRPIGYHLLIDYMAMLGRDSPMAIVCVKAASIIGELEWSSMLNAMSSSHAQELCHNYVGLAYLETSASGY